MAEVMFEILLFSAYLSAALISVVIAVYTISVSYLGRETSRSIWSLKKRQKELKNKIKKLAEAIDVGEMEKEIKRYRQEEERLKDKLRFLSIDGAVLLPLVALSVALFFSLVGMFVYQWHPNSINSYIAASLSANVVGVGLLLKVLKTVEWAALRVPLPSFRVVFPSGLKEDKMMTKEKGKFNLGVINNGELMAEDVDVMVFFHPDFHVIPVRFRYSVIKQPKRTPYPNYNGVLYSHPKIHTDVTMSSPHIEIEAPEKSGKYRIPIEIHEKNIGISEHELSLEVVD